MLPATFFRISIALPILLPLLLFPLDRNIVSGFLILSLFFGGVQYVLFAVWLFFAIGKKKNSAEIRYLSFRAPLLFIPLQIIGWFLWLWYKERSSLELEGAWQALILFTVFILVIGYCYVGITNVLFVICKKKGIIREP